MQKTEAKVVPTYAKKTSAFPPEKAVFRLGVSN